MMCFVILVQRSWCQRCFGATLVLDKAHSLFVDMNKEAWDSPIAPSTAEKAAGKIGAVDEPKSCRRSNKTREREFLRFLNIALGSAGDVQHQLKAAIDCRANAARRGDRTCKSRGGSREDDPRTDPQNQGRPERQTEPTAS